MLNTLQLNKYRILIWGTALTALLLPAGYSVSLGINRNAGQLVINEFVASNGQSLTDEDGDTSDWVEIFNPGKNPVNLSGYALTDDPNIPERWRFPNISLTGGDYLLVFASGKNRRSPHLNQPLHTNFRLSKAGDFLGLYNILDQKFTDSVSPSFPQQFRDMSFGRYGNNLALGYLGNPTPGAPNDASLVWSDIVDSVRFSTERGIFHNTPFNVNLSTNTPDAAIYYTTDGATPTAKNGILYTAPIEINQTTLLRAAAFKDGLLPSYVDTHTYIFLDTVLTQPAKPAGFPETWGVHKENFKAFVQGTPVEPDYEMDPEIVNNPRFHNNLVTGLQAIPSLSLVTEMHNFTDLYSNPQERGPNWERPVSVELIVPGGSQPNFQINAGVRIQGGVGRKEFIPKHSFRLFFKSQYGPNKLQYPFFSNSPVSEFDTLVLRGGVNRSYTGLFAMKKTTYTRDQWLRASQIKMSGLSPHGSFVHLYINGLYWGLYNVVERPDAAFTSAHLGGDEEEWIAINHSGPVDGPEDEVLALTAQFLALNKMDDSPEIRDRLKKAVLAMIDTTQFSDFIILNWYAGNQDWGENNWYIGLQREAGTIKYFSWDGEKIFFEGADIYLGKTDSSRPNVVIPPLELMLEDPNFKIHFADRMYKHLFNNGALTDDNAKARWQNISGGIEQAIVGESARWGDVRYDDPITQDDWVAANKLVLDQLDGNAKKLISLARKAGFYPPIDPPTFSLHGGQVEPGFKLALNSKQDVIYFTTNGVDPRQPDGKISPAAIAYKAPIPLTGTTYIKARTLNGTTWSALNEAMFQVSQPVNLLQFSEIMYNPPGDFNYEFIEIRNSGNTQVELANTSFTGIEFTFPANTPPLAPDKHIVLVGDATAFANQYPNVAIDGIYRGQLSNSGETISLHDIAGNIVISVTFDDEQGWPLSADGQGDSLNINNVAGNANNPKNWSGNSASPDADGLP